MNEFLIKGKLYKIITREIKNATKMNLKDFDDNFLYFNFSEFETSFKENDSVEIYTEIEQGIWYATTNVITYKNDELKLALPIKYEFLQRRKNERLLANSIIQIDNNGSKENVILKDFSANGIKILSNKQILLKQLYKIYLNFDKLNLVIDFFPMRLAVVEDKFEISGTISAKNRIEKIELIQYYQNKKIELKNRK